MRTLLKISFFLLIANSAFSQEIFLRGYNYRPTGEFGFVMKSTFSGEIGYRFGDGFEDDRRFRSSVSLSYLIMKPRMAVFPIYGNLSDGTGDHVLPGEQSFQKYNIAQLFGGFDLAFIKKDPFFAYAGFDIMVGAASVDYTDHVDGIEDAGYSGGGFLGGFRFRLGAQYNFNDNIGIFINAQRQVFLLTDPAAINWANDYGLGVKYKF